MISKIFFTIFCVASAFFSLLGMRSLNPESEFFSMPFSTTFFFALAAVSLLMALGVLIGMTQKDPIVTE